MTVADIMADNGVVHVIDAVLLPPAPPTNTILDVIQNSPEHMLLAAAVDAAGLAGALSGTDTLTVFAPTDDAIFAFAEENGFVDVDGLFDSPYWDEILRRHIVEVPLTSDQLNNNGLLVSYGGENIYTFVNGDGIFVENAQVTTPDLLAYNGVVHVINEVIDFEFPNPVGTCGTWTLNMYAPQGEGWSGVMQVLVDNVLVGEPTVQDGFSNSYAFAVNEGSSVDMNYISEFSGWPGNFEVVDAEGTILFDSDAPSNSSSQYGSAAGVYGLKACAAAPECSQIKVTLYSDFGGWDLANLLVYDGPVLADVIGGYWFNGDALIGYVDIQDGDNVNFEVNGGFYSDYYSYKVEDEEGNLLVDQVEQYVPAENVYGVVICAATGIAEESGLMEVRFAPNPATESVTLSGIAEGTPWELTVQTLMGQEALVTTGVGPGQIDLGTLASGTYLGRLRSENGATRGMRLVVQ